MAFTRPYTGARPKPSNLAIKLRERLTVDGEHAVIGESLSDAKLVMVKLAPLKTPGGRPCLSDLSVAPGGVIGFKNCSREAVAPMPSYRAYWPIVLTPSPDRGTALLRHANVISNSNGADRRIAVIRVLSTQTHHRLLVGGHPDAQATFAAKGLTACTDPKSPESVLDEIATSLNFTNAPTNNFLLVRAYDESGSSVVDTVLVKRTPDDDLRTPLQRAEKTFRASALADFIRSDYRQMIAVEIIPGISLFAGRIKAASFPPKRIENIQKLYRGSNDEPLFLPTYLATVEAREDGSRLKTPLWTGEYLEALEDGARPPPFDATSYPSLYNAGAPAWGHTPALSMPIPMDATP